MVVKMVPTGPTTVSTARRVGVRPPVSHFIHEVGHDHPRGERDGPTPPGNDPRHGVRDRRGTRGRRHLLRCRGEVADIGVMLQMLDRRQPSAPHLVHGEAVQAVLGCRPGNRTHGDGGEGRPERSHDPGVYGTAVSSTVSARWSTPIAARSCASPGTGPLDARTEVEVGGSTSR